MANPPTAQQYKDALTSNKNTFAQRLTDYKNAYIAYYMNPVQTNREYSLFNTAKYNVDNSISNISNLKSSVMASISILNDRIASKKTELQQNQTAYNNTAGEMNQATAKNFGDYDLLGETKGGYKYQYMKNATLIVGDILLAYIIYQYYRS